MTGLDAIGLLLAIGLFVFLVVRAPVSGELPMTAQGLLQLAFYLAVLLLLVKPLGAYMAAVFEGDRTFMTPVLGPLERCDLPGVGRRPDTRIGLEAIRGRGAADQPAGASSTFTRLQRLQGVLPLNPQALARWHPTPRSIRPSASRPTRTGRATPARRR